MKTKLLCILVWCTLGATSSAQIPETFSWQGYLEDAAGDPLAGTVNLILYLYEAESGGVPVWTHDAIGVPVSNGVVNLQLGPFPGVDFYAPLFLGVRVNGGAELDPRTPLTAAPYALSAMSATVSGYAFAAGELALPFAASANVAASAVLSVANTSADGYSVAVEGTISPTNPGGFSTAVRGINHGEGGLGIGVWGSQEGSGWGVYGLVNGSSGRAIYGRNEDPGGWAGYFLGKTMVTGILTKGAGSFQIDHPLDPENMYLHHSFVESPDMMNVYNGMATLNAHGEAEVSLPDWFDALNKDYRYQLTPVGAPAPNLHVSEEVTGNRFRIAGGSAGQRVSWQVTGIRDDAFARQNRIPVEQLKPEKERGMYLHPTAFGLDSSKSIESAYDFTIQGDQ